MKRKNIRKRIFEILEKAKPGDIPSRIFDIFIMSLILVNVIMVILGTVKALATQYTVFFKLFEVISIAIFTIEYLLRLWSSTVNEQFKEPIRGRIRFALTPLSLVDLVAILPFYLPMVFPCDLRFIRIVRLLRIFRIFKIGRYSQAMKTFALVIKKKKEELFITVFAVLILLVISSSLMYFVENEAQPEVFSSIPAAMWWGVATLTTVGYGDVYPITGFGKFLGAIIALLGIGLFALPAGVIASGFIEEIQHRALERNICPYCGKEINVRN